MLERHSLSDPRPFNTTVVIDAAGSLVRSYRKSHLYDAFSYKESDTIAPGDRLFDPIVTPFGDTGLFVCYELRFPEVARNEALKGATILFVPSAWVMGPLKLMHWRTLIMARAIENGCYVVAAAQCGNGYAGHSLMLDPMGEEIVEGGDDEVVLTGEVNPERVDQVRNTVPSLKNRRPELYAPEEQSWTSAPDAVTSSSS
jgi:predicted amidohydrolase